MPPTSKPVQYGVIRLRQSDAGLYIFDPPSGVKVPVPRGTEVKIGEVSDNGLTNFSLRMNGTWYDGLTALNSNEIKEGSSLLRPPSKAPTVPPTRVECSAEDIDALLEITRDILALYSKQEKKIAALESRVDELEASLEQTDSHVTYLEGTFT